MRFNNAVGRGDFRELWAVHCRSAATVVPLSPIDFSAWMSVDSRQLITALKYNVDTEILLS